MRRILLVDDNEENLAYLSTLLRAKGCDVETARHGAEALTKARGRVPDLVISDLLMPVMDGYTLLREWKADARLSHAPFMVYTATYTDPQDERLALDLGADGFLVKPAEPEPFWERVEAIAKRATDGNLAEPRIPLVEEEGALSEYNRALVRKLEAKTRELEVANQRFRRVAEEAVLAMGQIVESRDPYTAGHERRVAELAAAIGVNLGLETDRLEALRLASTIHDIGKISVPAEILSRPGRLSAVEFELVKGHPRAAYDILEVIDFDLPLADIVVQHHERLDGSGYPNGLVSGAILPSAKILAVADVVEAMTSHRPYRPALSMDEALEELRVGQGTLYDPDAVAACIHLMETEHFAFDAQGSR